jgi:hypothetical protein
MAPAALGAAPFGEVGLLRPEPMQLRFGGVAAVGPDGNLYVTGSDDAQTSKLQQVTPDGQFIRTIGQPSDPRNPGPGLRVGLGTVATALNGDIYTVGYDGSQPHIAVFKPDGTFVTSWPIPVTFGFSTKLAVGPTGNVYALQGCVIRVYSATGAPLSSFGHCGQDPAGLSGANSSGIAAAPSGDIYVADGDRKTRDAIKQFAADGTFIRAFGDEVRERTSIAVGPSNQVYVMAHLGPIAVFTGSGALVSRFGQGNPRGTCGLNQPSHIAASSAPSSDNRIYLSQANVGNILGSVISIFGPAPPAVPCPSYPPVPTVRPRPPVITGFGLIHVRFQVGVRPTPFVTGRTPAPVGTAFRYRLSKNGIVTIRISRLALGRRRGGGCRPVRRLLPGERRCTAVVAVGSLRRGGRRGFNRVAFSGRLGRRPLRSGSYVARITARTLGIAGVSRSRQARFIVLP